jgi:ATP-dependent Clp protease ATP-binding subunit ClpA
MTECVTSKFVADKLEEVVDTAPDEEDFKGDSFRRFAGCLTIKELLVYNVAELHDRFVGHMNQVILIKQKSIAQVTKEFVSSELYTQRTMIIQLLLRSKDYEYQYLAYLLYDLLTNDNNGSVDTHEQTLLFDSLPFSVKKYFRDAMKQTISYTNNLSNFDSTKIPLEQQICLMKADEVVKEKAMQKLKEVKAKSEDSGSKARQYLEGLLRIPFKVFREEPILRIIGNSTDSFNSMVGKLTTSSVPITQFPVKPTYTSVEMLKYAPLLRDQYMGKARGQLRNGAKEILTAGRRSDLVETVCVVNQFLKENGVQHSKLCHSGKKNSHMREAIQGAVDCLGDRMDLVTKMVDKAKGQTIDDHLPALATTLDTVANASSTVSKFMDGVATTLNDAVHGHDKAKRQVERIIAQWVNGEKSGYCFGFEGPPGVGKTSLAKKGIANCLVDGEGKSRPFAFIAMGGKENGRLGAYC